MENYGINYETLPVGLVRGMRLYVEDRVLPGSFLCAVLKDNFVDAVCKADDVNIARLKDIAVWVYNELPYSCWGSEEKVSTWVGKKGVE